MKNKIILTLIGMLLGTMIITAGTVVQIPEHLQNISFWRCMITAKEGSADVVAYFTNNQGKMPPVGITKTEFGGYDKVLAIIIQNIMDTVLAARGYDIVESTVDWDVSGTTMTEAVETNIVDEVEVITKVITIRQDI
jgi:hypothetical protein